MKNLVLIIFSCSDDDGGGGTEPEPVNFEPTGFTLTYNDSVYTDFQNGEYMSDADTVRLDRYLGERTFEINFMDSDGKIFENVDPLRYVTFVEVINTSELEDPIVHGTAIDFELSLTPHDEGVTHFLLQVTDDNDGSIVFKADSLFVEIY